MSVPTQVVKLVEQFKEESQGVKSSDFKEAWVRRDYIDPFFSALGWDVSYQRRGPKIFREVMVEDTLKVEGVRKAPDYSFRTGGVTRFFVEAKKPSVNLWDGRAAAFQVRRYAWSAKLSLSILTDFEELAVYDCQIKPVKEDKASTARRLYMSYEEYPDRWDEIASLFSKEAVLSGSLDAYAQEPRKKKGVAPVDQEFLKEMESWREMLAKDLAQRNPSLTRRELNYAVQMTIDRIIFLRICEDRDIEDYGRLQMLLGTEDIYEKLCDLFRDADDRYNSGLFHFKREKRDELPDELTLNLELADQPLKKLIKGLYYPEPYQFGVMPVEILGQVYEQFLGKVINLSPDHRATVEEKPEVRKAGGVYYTPSYIVDYIVKNTVGKLLEGKTPRQVSKLKILDPACGSGSFLIGAYSYLLEWHREFYVNDGPDKHAKLLYEGLGGEWQLTSAEKKRILLNNIYGVDLDSQAVEVTKLSLLLKVLEGETNESINSQLTFFKERALPDLDNNIKWGNSLIGWDFYDNEQISFLNEEERYRINVFDWTDAFPGVFEGKNPGFDAVIGNPPWGADVQTSEKLYLRQKYGLNVGKYESYIFFLEKASTLLNHGGTLGFIVPSYWISRSQTEGLRTHLWGNLWPQALIVLPENVFNKVKMDSVIIIASHDKLQHINVADLQKDELHKLVIGGKFQLPHRTIETILWQKNSAIRFNPRITSEDVPVLQRFAGRALRLSSIVDLTQGLTLYRRSTLTERFGKDRAEEIVSKRLFHSDYKKDETFKKELLGRDVSRYSVVWNGKNWISYGPWLAHAVDERFFKGPRLVLQKLRNPSLSQRLVVGYLDDQDTYSAGVLLNAILKPDQKYHLFYIMGLLNSKGLNYWYRKRILDVSIRVVDLAQVPICMIDFSDSTDVAHHDRMVELVEQMLKLHEQLLISRTANDKNFIQRQIDMTDRQIDRLVYELYELTEDEIKIIEG